MLRKLASRLAWIERGLISLDEFSSNVADLLSAIDYLRNYYQAPALLIGHSFGGAAILAVAQDVANAGKYCLPLPQCWVRCS